MHPRNIIRLQGGLTIDPLLEKAGSYSKDMKGKKKGDYPGKVDGQNSKKAPVAEAHVGKVGSTIQDRTGKEWIIKGEGPGEGREEVYELECPKSGRRVEKKASELVKEMETVGASEVTPNPRASEQVSNIGDFQDGDLMFYNNGIYVVVLSDAKTDMIGIIPAGLINASAAEKNRAVEMVKPDAAKCRKPTREEIEVFKMSDDELKAVDDDMDIKFSAEGFDMKKAVRGGAKYAKATGGREKGFDKKAKKAKIKKGTEECEVSEMAAAGAVGGGAGGVTTAHDVGAGGGHGTTEAKSSSLGKRLKKRRKVKESTHNYAPGNKKSHKDVQSDPINIVGQGEKQWANSLDPKEVKNEYTLQRDNRGEQSMTEENEKVKVPNTLKSGLKTAIKAFKEDAAKQGNTHTARENAQMMMDTAEAFQQILDYLNEASVMDIKHAQIFAQTLMGPMLHKLPDGVWDFLSHGGQKRSLKDYMIKVDG